MLSLKKPFFSLLKKNSTFYFEVIINSYAVIRSNTERSQVPSFLLREQPANVHNWDTDIDRTCTSLQGALGLPFAATPTSSHHQAPLCPSSLLLPFQDSQDRNVDHLLQEPPKVPEALCSFSFSLFFLSLLPRLGNCSFFPTVHRFFVTLLSPSPGLLISDNVFPSSEFPVVLLQVFCLLTLSSLFPLFQPCSSPLVEEPSRWAPYSLCRIILTSLLLITFFLVSGSVWPEDPCVLSLVSPLSLFKWDSTLLPGTEVIVWGSLGSPLVNILFRTKLLSLLPLSWDMDGLTLWLTLPLVPLVTVAVRLVFWSLSFPKEVSCTTAYIYS